MIILKIARDKDMKEKKESQIKSNQVVVKKRAIAMRAVKKVKAKMKGRTIIRGKAAKKNSMKVRKNKRK